MTEASQYTAHIDSSSMGHRLDQVCVQMFPEFSRARLQKWIKQGRLLVNNEMANPKQKVAGGEYIVLNPEPEEAGTWLPEPIDLNIVFEDDSLIIVNKPAGLVVHPGAGNSTGTLLNGLLHHSQELSNIPRAGIVHRLDKDTTGLMVVAKTLQAQTDLVRQLQARLVSREYQAVTVYELSPLKGTIETNMGRHAQHRTKMSVLTHSGKPAVTHYTLKQSLNGFSLVDVKLDTGRTHQIRVHMAHLGCPLVGDKAYGKTHVPATIKRQNEGWQSADNFTRQALHARRLSFTHPVTKRVAEWEIQLPADMRQLIDDLSKG